MLSDNFKWFYTFFKAYSLSLTLIFIFFYFKHYIAFTLNESFSNNGKQELK